MADEIQLKKKAIRWQEISIRQLGYTLNLIFTLAVAGLAYAFALLRDPSFLPGPSARCFMLFSLFSLGISAGLGFLCILNRLTDIHGSSRRASDHPLKPSKEEMHERGRLTWCLFRGASWSFAAGVLLLAVTMLLVYGARLA